MAAFTSIEREGLHKIESYRQKNARQIHAALEQAYGDQTLSYSQVAQWVVDLRKGRETIQNDYRSGRPVTMTDGFNIEKVSDLLKSDRRFTCDEVATEVSISKGSVHTIIRDHLEMRKVAAHLTSDQIELRLEIATDLFRALLKKEMTFFLGL